MNATTFSFFSEAAEGIPFVVVSYSANEGLSKLYQYEIQVKLPLASAIDLDDALASRAKFVIHSGEKSRPIHGVLSSIDELKTLHDYVYYKVVLVPKLWQLSIFKTNEIYTQEKTVDNIIETVLTQAGFVGSSDPSMGDFDLDGLDDSEFLRRDYICQFGESDFDFISRIMENEGIFYYFEQSEFGPEKVIFGNVVDYPELLEPQVKFEVSSNPTGCQPDSVDAWSCRKQNTAANVTVRDYNPVQPSLDVMGSYSVDSAGLGSEYLYGENFADSTEAGYLARIRAEELSCQKTSFCGEGAVPFLMAGYVFNLSQHPNPVYRGRDYLLIDIHHEGEYLDMKVGVSGNSGPQYRNSFTAIDSSIQFRPIRVTAKPRFYGTMTAFIYAEAGNSRPEVNEKGEYRVHLPFDRADGGMLSSDPDRKASAWMRMAQPYVGQDQGVYYPLTGGTEVLLTFINGDPDQPIISAALPNASRPSLQEENPEWVSSVSVLVTQQISGNTHSISMNRDGVSANLESISNNSDGISNNSDDITSNREAIEELQNPPASPIPTASISHYINDGTVLPKSMIPPWTVELVTDPSRDEESPIYNESLIKFKKYDKDFAATDMVTEDLNKVSTDRGAGDNYVYANARTFAYPQHERVFFIGTFHEDFHMKDDFVENPYTTADSEVFHFPEPGGDGTQADSSDTQKTEAEVNPSGVRGVSEDKRWGDQLTYAYGRKFNWSAGDQLGDGGAFGEFNYGNGYTENLICLAGGVSSDSDFEYSDQKDTWNHTAEGTPSVPFNPARTLAPAAVGIQLLLGGVGGVVTGIIKGAIWAASHFNVPSKNDLTTTWELDPSITSADKTFGHTYSYHMGLSVGVHEGNSLSKTYGDTASWTHGNAESYTQGDSVSTTLGTSSDMFLGSKYEMTVGTSDALTVGITTDTFIGLKNENFIGGSLAFNLAASKEVDLTGRTQAATKKESLAASQKETALKAQSEALNIMINSLKSEIKALKHEIKALDVTVSVTNIKVIAVKCDILAAFVKIG